MKSLLREGKIKKVMTIGTKSYNIEILQNGLESYGKNDLYNMPKYL